MPVDFAVFGDDALPDSPIRKLMRGAANTPIQLDIAPTTAAGELAEGVYGYFGTDLYITLGGTTYKIATLTPV